MQRFRRRQIEARDEAASCDAVVRCFGCVLRLGAAAGLRADVEDES